MKRLPSTVRVLLAWLPVFAYTALIWWLSSQALQVLPDLAYAAVQARERLKAFQQLRIDLVRKIYRANPATLTNPTGLSHRDLAQWSGLTPMRVSQLLSDVYRAKPADGGVTGQVPLNCRSASRA